MAKKNAARRAPTSEAPGTPVVPPGHVVMEHGFFATSPEIRFRWLYWRLFSGGLGLKELETRVVREALEHALYLEDVIKPRDFHALGALAGKIDNAALRTFANRSLGLPDRRPSGNRDRYNAKQIKQDWRDLTEGKGNGWYATHGSCGLAAKCGRHRDEPRLHATRGARGKVVRGCEDCRAYWAPVVGGLTRNEAVAAIAHVRGYASEAACARYLHRIGILGAQRMRDRD